MKLIITQSFPYDRALSNLEGFRLPDEESQKKCMEFKTHWQKKEKEILSAIFYVTGIPWQRETLTAYMVNGNKSWSDPLTVSLYKTVDETIDSMTHELIHANLAQLKAASKIKQPWLKLMKEYKKESRICRIHVGVHAIHEAVMYKLGFSKKHIEVHKKTTKHPEYVRSWELIDKAGYKAIIKKLEMRAD